MSHVVLIVDDQPDILFNLKMTLELNNYPVLTATNGEEAIKILSELGTLPNLIISDIMMPKMNGYDFFKTVSANPEWAFIPFIFLSARRSPEDIRFGKMLGVDDYLTKPIDEDDLLAIITGKLARTKQTEMIKRDLKERLRSLDVALGSSISEGEKSQVWIFLVVWDEEQGPQVTSSFPKEIGLCPETNPTIPPISLESLGLQLYQGAVSIYGWEGLYDAQGLLLQIENIKRSGYIFFDSYPDKEVRGGRRQFMVTIIAPEINYFDSLKIKELLKDLSIQIKATKKLNLKKYWEAITEMLVSPVL